MTEAALSPIATVPRGLGKDSFAVIVGVGVALLVLLAAVNHFLPVL